MIICKVCKEKRPQEARGMCVNCYRNWQYANDPKIKLRMREASTRWREKNRERFNERAREYYHNKIKPIRRNVKK